MVARFNLEIFALAIFPAMGLLTILNHRHHHNGFVYQHARFGPDQKSNRSNDPAAAKALRSSFFESLEGLEARLNGQCGAVL